MSTRIRVLEAALLLSGRSLSFSAEQLVLMAWGRHPEVFGLRGFESVYPDANRVLYCLMGDRGLVAQGLMARPSARVYQLTDAGLTYLRLTPGVPVTPVMSAGY